MVAVASRREFTIALFLLLQFASRISAYKRLSVLADSTAFVNQFKPLSTCNQQPVWQQLRLETSPLIGGPSWLPLHVKVVLKDRELFHQWDLIPIDATSVTTLQKLTTLQYVPAQIRYRIYTTSQNSIDEASSQQELLWMKIYNADTLPEMSDSINMAMDNSLVPTEKYFVLNIDEDCIGQEQIYILQAHRFCQSYMYRTNMELHLVWNNCWTFAFQLVLNVLQSSYRDTRD
jgi:hypothetical protein